MLSGGAQPRAPSLFLFVTQGIPDNTKAALLLTH